jgi:hypothetical protein
VFFPASGTPADTTPHQTFSSSPTNLVPCTSTILTQSLGHYFFKSQQTQEASATPEEKSLGEARNWNQNKNKTEEETGSGKKKKKTPIIMRLLKTICKTSDSKKQSEKPK